MKYLRYTKKLLFILFFVTQKGVSELRIRKFNFNWES